MTTIDRDGMRCMADHERMNYWWRRAKGAEAERDRLQAHYDQARRTIEHGAASEAAAILGYQDRADRAEARIRAVRDVLDRHQSLDRLGKRVRRALDGDGNPDQACGRGPCALGNGHTGPCRR